MAASVLLLVPGFPLINAVADMFKGHVNTGLARWAMASLLTLSTCIGVVFAMALWGLRGGREFTVGITTGHGVSCDPGVGLCHGIQCTGSCTALLRTIGAIGHGSRMLMIHFGMNIELASLVASIMIGINWSRWLLAHPKVLLLRLSFPCSWDFRLYRHDIGG